LTEVLVLKLVYFKVNQNVTPQQPVIKNQIHEEVLLVKRESLLPRLIEKPFAKFQKKLRHFTD
jgi:hypothetical protein